jgi:hypothetical protein
VTIPFWTRSGTIDLENLTPENLTAEVIGDTLAKINRFGGRTNRPWSVAAHSVLVEYLAPPELRPWAILHDAHEIFIGDLTEPGVEFLCLCGTRPAVENAVANAKARLDRIIGSAWGVAVRSQNQDLRRADYIALLAEANVFLGTRPELTSAADRDDFDRALTLIADLPCHWQEARALWISRAEHYASLGLLALPKATDPSSAVLAG